MEYLDFDLALTRNLDGGYRVRADTPHWGSVARPSSFSVEDPEIVAGLRDASAGTLDRAELEGFGALIFAGLFPGDVAIALGASIGDASCLGKGLRIRLRIDPPELQAVPWEYAYYSLRHRFLGADVATPVTRHLESFDRIPPSTIEPPLRLLVVAPIAQGIDGRRELDVLEDALRPVDAFIDLDVLGGGRPVEVNDFVATLRRGTHHVAHFIGHSGLRDGGGVLYLNGPQGGPAEVPAVQVAEACAGAHQLRLVVLNSCEGAAVRPDEAGVGLAQHLVHAGVLSVLAQRYPIGDTPAVGLAGTFYSSLVASAEAGLVESAVARVRSEFSTSQPVDRIVSSVLFVQGSGPLFSFDAPSESTIRTLEQSLRDRQRIEGRCRAALDDGASAYRQKRWEDATLRVEAASKALERARRQREIARGRNQPAGSW